MDYKIFEEIIIGLCKSFKTTEDIKNFFVKMGYLTSHSTFDILQNNPSFQSLLNILMKYYNKDTVKDIVYYAKEDSSHCDYNKSIRNLYNKAQKGLLEQ